MRISDCSSDVCSSDLDDHSPEQLMDRWHGELDAIGHTPASILDSIERSAPARRPAERLSERELAELVGWVLSPTGPLAGDKRFGRAEVIDRKSVVGGVCP